MKSFWIVTRGHEALLERRDVPEPAPRRGEVVVRVHASALNRGELFVGGAVHGGPEKLGGSECSGVIHALGEGVSGWKAGDRVMGRARGAWAPYALMEAAQVLPMPARLTWEQAAAIPSSFLTSYEALVRLGRIEKGEWMLVLGASSGVGVGAIQIAQVLGAHSIGTSGSEQKLEKLKSMGLNVGICTRSPDFSGKVRAASGGNGANIALNLVGASVFPEILRSLAYQGRVAIVGYVDRKFSAEIDLNAVHVNRYAIFGVSNAKLPADQKALTTRAFERDILPALADGRITPLVDRVFEFDELPAAKRHMEADAMVGKIVVRVAA
ncbi:MAG: zinc-binding dehydrogenase [Burkholderiales bacterium]|nr:zinc-binding dehydrogenase [Burkholderiales bacterium]